MSPVSNKSPKKTADLQTNRITNGMSKTMTLYPRISEKAYGLSQATRTYIFDVPREANRLNVAAAVAAQFGVTVEEVRISNVKGKVKQSYRKRSRPVTGKRSDVKRAFVKVKEGDKLPIFAAEEEEAKEAEKAAKKSAKKTKETK